MLGFISTLRQVKQNQCLWQPPVIWNIGYAVQLFLSPKRSWELGVSSRSYGTVPRIGIMVRVYFPTGFDVTSFMLAQGVGTSQLDSGLLTKGICSFIVVSVCL